MADSTKAAQLESLLFDKLTMRRMLSAAEALNLMPIAQDCSLVHVLLCELINSAKRSARAIQCVCSH